MTTRLPLSTARSTSVNTSSEPYDFDSPSAVSGVLPHGAGFGNAQLGHLVLAALGLQARQQPLGTLGHVLGRLRLGRLGTHLVGLGEERVGLLLRVRPLALAAALVGLALLQVRRPADVVDVELGPVGVQVEHPVDRLLQQGHVVADHHQTAAVRLQEPAQPDDGVGVEVVGRLVEQQRLGAGEQDPGQLDPAALTARERAAAAGRAPGPAGPGWR